MIQENDRESLIAYRLNQANETIELAKFLVKNEKLDIAVNRIYYGMYYALTALALKNKFDTSKHVQLIGWFNKEFVFSKRVDAKYGKILRNAFQYRTRGDYDAFVSFSKIEIEFLVEEMVDFIEEISRILDY